MYAKTSDRIIVTRHLDIEWSQVDYHEHALTGADEKDVRDGPSFSKKGAVAAWLRSMISCSQIPLLRRRHHRRPHHDRTGHPPEQSPQNKTEAQVPIIRHCNNSQVSIAKTSTKDSIKATPSELVRTEDLLVNDPFPTHIYESMPCDNSIRLLRIYKGALGDPIEVSLELARLDETTPAYEALSYVWGSNIRVSKIINRPTHAAITVTRNLCEALKGVRQVHQDRVIWVDALCINQNDGKEKGTQVHKMNSIYARASSVIVWLGADESGDANDAFGALCALAITKGATALYTTRSPNYVPHVPESFSPTKENFPLCRKVMFLFVQTWFLRLWVLQEIVLAQDANFVWGDCSIMWKYIGLAIEAIMEDQTMSRIFETRNLHNACIMWRLSRILDSQEEHSESNTSSIADSAISFLHLLDMARSFAVSDPRDKIYGLLGFPIQDENMNENPIIPDYTLSASEVYTQVTRSLLEQEQNLNPLALIIHTPPGFAESQTHIDSLPSWVPNFFSGETAYPFSNVNVGHQYTAGFSRPFELLSTADPRALRLRGIQIDTVRAVGSSIPYVQLHEMRGALHTLVMWSMDFGVSMTTLAASLSAGRDKEGKLLSQEEKDQCESTLVLLLKDFGFDTPGRSGERGSLRGVKGDLKDAIWRFLTYRQPFVTESGKFGLGPRGTVAGDHVMVLWGGQVPFVASKTEDGKWMLKSECFVEEWVYGDSVDALVRKEEKQDMVFEFV